MNWTTKPVYNPIFGLMEQAKKDIEEITGINKIAGDEPIKPSLTINEDGPLGEAGDFTIEPSGIPEKWSQQNRKHINKVPTHDPYTNPNAHIYYSCDCGNILDPGTKRFAELNNAAMDAGWKVRWGHEYYEPFCPGCVMLKGIE